MSAFLQSLTASMLDQHRLATLRHEQAVEEIRELITSRRDHRIDIMALFEISKETRERMKKSEL